MICSGLCMLISGAELAGVFQVDVPFLLQQAQLLYQKELIDLQLQMQRVNSSTSGLGGSKGIYISLLVLIIGSAESQNTGASSNIDATLVHRPITTTATPTRPPLSPLVPQTRPSRTPSHLIISNLLAPRGSAPPSPSHIQSSFRQRKSSGTSPLVADLHPSIASTNSSSSSKSNSSAAALRLYEQLQQQPPEQEEQEEDEPAFLPLTRPTTANKSPSKESDSFSDLSDASVSKSALEEALEEHLRKGGSVAGSQMPGVRSIWRQRFNN